MQFIKTNSPQKKFKILKQLSIIFLHLFQCFLNTKALYTVWCTLLTCLRDSLWQSIITYNCIKKYFCSCNNYNYNLCLLKIFKLRVTFQMHWTQGENENMVPYIVQTSRSLYEYFYYHLSIICKVKPKAMDFIRTRTRVKSWVWKFGLDFGKAHDLKLH